MYLKLCQLTCKPSNWRKAGQYFLRPTRNYVSLECLNKSGSATETSLHQNTIKSKSNIPLLSKQTHRLKGHAAETAKCISSYNSNNSKNYNFNEYGQQKDDNNNNEACHNFSSFLSISASIFGAILVFSKLYSDKDEDSSAGLLTVHAAKVIVPPNDDFTNRQDEYRRDYYNNNNNNSNSSNNDDNVRRNNIKNVYVEPPPARVKGSMRQQFNFIADIVENASKAVVCIEVKDHSMIDWFNGHPRTASNGSGFIIQSNGLILTNAHVVNTTGRSSISVRLHDGRVFAGKVEIVDSVSDLALVRISANNLPTLSLGTSSEARIGEWVVAIGSPLSLTNSVSAGVVSSCKRGASELGLMSKMHYIQTDTAITFGNSGGPLVNLDGEAIGVNTMKVTSGISFAIPSDYVKKFIREAEELKRSGRQKSHRRYMGVTLIDLTDDMVVEKEQKEGVRGLTPGVMVYNVVVGSPAYVVGIHPGDIIEKINSKDVKSVKDVFDALETSHSLTIIIRRGNTKFKCVIHPEDIPY